MNLFLRETDTIKDRIAIEDRERNCLTYSELDALSKAYLRKIPERAVVFILCDYHIDTVAFYYCMMNNHVVPLLLDRGLDTQLMENLIQAYHPQFLWIPKSRGIFSEHYVPAKESQEHILLAAGWPSYPLYEQLALLLTTSGSTGSQKLVRISYENLISWSNAMISLFTLRNDDKSITTLPMNYCYGLSVMLMHWMVGATVCVTDSSVLSVGFWNFLAESKATNFAGVPFTYKMLEKIHFLEKNYPSLRFITQAGGKLSEEKQMLFGRKLGSKEIEFYIAYGQTEGVSMMTYVPCRRVIEKLGSVGIPVDGVSAYVEGESVGELIIEGGCVSLGYAEKWADLAKGDENKGILHTGDLAYMDEDGYIYLKGRKKRFIKLLGIRVSLDEVESILNNEFPECEFACTGEDDCLKIYGAGDISIDAVSNLCRKRLGIERKMLAISMMDRLPRNSSGKLIYSEL